MTPSPTATTKNTSPAQRRVINTDRTFFLGWDEKNRPVVERMTGIPQQLRRWAVCRNGNPAEVTGFIRTTWMGEVNEW